MFLLNNTHSISVGKLNKCDFLRGPKLGVISWQKGERLIADIIIYVDVCADSPSMELIYEFGGEPVHQTISLTPVPSNLGTGVTWYFTCPVTGKRARKLFFINGQSVHRDAHKGSMYFSQTLSQKDRQLKKLMDGAFAEEKIDEKHFTPFYRGKPTVKYKSIMKKVQKAEGLDIDELLR
jgi:hypothetical protein